MLKLAIVSALLMALAPASLALAVEPKVGDLHPVLSRRSNPDPKGFFKSQQDIPDYIVVSPDLVALAPSGPSGLSSAGLNNMMCLTNRYRYDSSLPPLALDAQLVKFAQARAEFFDKGQINITNNIVVGMEDPPVFDTAVWKDVMQNLLYTTNNPTFAYWQLQGSDVSSVNLRSKDAVYFGAGKSGNYYVQAFGVPAKPISMDRSLFPQCTSNQTFYNWVYPNGTPNPPTEKSSNYQKAFPHELLKRTSPVKYVKEAPGYDTGRVNSTKYYFTPEEGHVPYLKSLEIPDNVAPINSKTPYAATGGSGEEGMTMDELNLMVCLHNARRYEACLPPLALHPKLIATAQAHSYGMNRALNLSHWGEIGPPGQRAARRGFQFSSIGENIVAFTHDVYTGFATFSRSQGHLNNIIGNSYKYIGGGRSGQFWAVNFGTLADNSQNPDPKNVPLCPGNATAIAIAFPNGLPKEPRLEANACGSTVATPLKPPPYFETANKGPKPTDSKPTEPTVPFEFKPPAPTPTPTNNSDVSYVTVTIETTIYVDQLKQVPQDGPSSSSDPTNYPLMRLNQNISLIVPPS
ncbi:hypothetical protein H4S02_007916 [Coemansia sp. RSA 2611]|nr:hypothetical protein H4S02_007916 [Coemansia sp. RSA 2611]